MYRWSKCPGSVRLSEGIESKSSKFAEEGTLAHEIAAERLLTGKYREGVDPEMLEHIDVYVKAVDEMTVGDRLIEHQFDLSEVHPGLFGTCDAIVYNLEKKLLSVVDLKFGAGIPVEVTDNVQLKYYALGALLSTKALCNEVELVIIQPRCNHSDGPVRKWKLPTIDLLDFAADLKKYAEKTEDIFAPLSAGEHCRFCPAAGICTEIGNKAQTLAKLEFKPIENKLAGGGVEGYDPQQLSKTLEWLPTLEGWIKSVRDFAYSEASAGKSVPGWKLVEKRKTRKWTNEVDATNYLQVYGDQVFEPRSLKSVAQVEKLLSKSEKSRLEPLITAASTGSVLVPEDDNRPAVVVLDAKTEFRQVTEEMDLLS
jgi:hypothetical protein